MEQLRRQCLQPAGGRYLVWEPRGLIIDMFFGQPGLSLNIFSSAKGRKESQVRKNMPGDQKHPVFKKLRPNFVVLSA